MQQPKAQPPLHVSADLFHQHKLRIEKNRRIADDLRASGHRRRQRLDEITGVEATSIQRPDLHKLSAKEEVYVDACGWDEGRLRMTYVSPAGEKIEEVLVVFTRKPPGEDLEWLTREVAGEETAPLISADLFDARLISRKHAVPAPHRKCEIRMIPRVDGRGAYLGVYSVMIDVS